MFSTATYGTSSAPLSTTYGATTYGASTSYGTSTTYGASSKTVLPTTYGTAGSVRKPISTTVAAATTNTVAPTTKTTTVVKGFAAGMRISYKARKDGKSYPGSVISQTPGGGLKIKLDGGDVKDLAAADMFRVTLDSTTTNSGASQTTVTSNRASVTSNRASVTSNRASSAPPSSPTKEAKVLKKFSVGKKTVEGKTIKPAGKTSLPTGFTSFAPGQRINYVARKDGKTYPGSVVSQTAGGLKIKLDGGNVKDIAAADLSRVSLAPIGGSLSAPISPKQSVTKAVTPRSVATKPAMATAVASKPAMTKTVAPKPAAPAVSGGKKMAKTLGGGIDLLAMGNVVGERAISIEEMSATGHFVRGQQEYVPGDLIM